MALALLEAESRMRRITGYEDLPKLKRDLKEGDPGLKLSRGRTLPPALSTKFTYLLIRT